MTSINEVGLTKIYLKHFIKNFFQKKKISNKIPENIFPNNDFGFFDKPEITEQK